MSIIYLKLKHFQIFFWSLSSVKQKLKRAFWWGWGGGFRYNLKLEIQKPPPLQILEFRYLPLLPSPTISNRIHPRLPLNVPPLYSIWLMANVHHWNVITRYWLLAPWWQLHLTNLLIFNTKTTFIESRFSSFILHSISIIFHSHFFFCIFNPSSIIRHHSSFIFHPTFFILHFSFYIFHPTFFILHPLSFNLNPLYAFNPSSFISI